MNNLKIFALYLPQYHSIPENDEWWGKGFTEWTNVKKAKPLFKGHNQPRVPLNDNYYNLLDDNTFKWQISLAKKYGIDGFCFYHYWFDGKLLLERPLEKYLNNKEYDFPFFFSWANEPWARTWDGHNKSILVNQVYEGDDDIINHFNYMLPFFSDDRYLKIDGKPVFVLYRANSITYLENMIEIWNRLSHKNGFNGIFFIESLTGFQNDKISTNTNACFYFEPMWSRKNYGVIDRAIRKVCSLFSNLKTSSYEKVCKTILKKEKLSDDRYAGFFVDWDNTPRKGKNGVVFLKRTIQSFDYYFTELLKKMKRDNCPFVFINAWNEWGEGTYLEPDTSHGYYYLETVKKCKNCLLLGQYNLKSVI